MNADASDCTTLRCIEKGLRGPLHGYGSGGDELAPASTSRRNSPPRRYPKLSTAPDCHGEQRRVRVTHPFHPLFGQEFDLLTYRNTWGEDRAYFHNPTGVKQLMS